MLSYDERYPVLLPTHSHVTKLMIMSSHQKVYHQGVEATLNELRSSYWIPQGTRTAKDLLRKCVLCKRHQGKVMVGPPLPDYRSSSTRAFETVGFDHAGPLYVRSGKQECTKVYVLLLTCATTRAIQLEL